jgi:hypothetical protein
VAVLRPASRATLTEAAPTLKKLLDAVEAGDLDVSSPREVALLRCLQGTLAGWDEALGWGSDERDHTE